MAPTHAPAPLVRPSAPAPSAAPRWLRVQAPLPPGSPAPIDSWASYYRLRGLPPESPAALLLDAVLTLQAAVARLQQLAGSLLLQQQRQQQQQACEWSGVTGRGPTDGDAGHGCVPSAADAQRTPRSGAAAAAPPPLPQPLVLHLLGPQRELDAWPLLLELGCLLPPGQQLEVHLMGPEVPPWAHGRSVHVAPPADGPCGRPGCSCTRSAGWGSVAAAPHPIDVAGPSGVAGAADGPTSHRQQQGQGPEAGSAVRGQQGGRSGGHAGCQALFFWRGEWHELSAELAQRHGAPHAVVAPNAGQSRALG